MHFHLVVDVSMLFLESTMIELASCFTFFALINAKIFELS
jgi:hypothetical protein